MGELPKISDAEEPTNIIWENLEVSRFSRLLLLLGVLLAISVILSACFIGILYLQRLSNFAHLKYVNEDCTFVTSVYNEPLLKDYAVKEWFEYYHPSNETLPKVRIGATLDCFCQKE